MINIDHLRNKDIERGLLCALTMEYQDMTAIVKDYDFTVDAYRELYNIINTEKTSDLNILKTAADKAGINNPESIISEIVATSTMPYSADRLARELRELSERRKRHSELISELNKNSDIAVPWQEMSPVLVPDLYHDVAPEITRPADHAEKFIESLDHSKFLGTATGWNQFDRIFGGTRTGELTVISGNTSSGKSTFGLNWLYQCALNNMPGIVLPFERSIYLCIRKLVEIQTERELFRWSEYENKYTLTEAPEWIGGELLKLNNANIWIFDKRKKSEMGRYSLERMGALLKYAAETIGIKFVLTDHLHYFVPKKAGQNEESMISETMRCLHTWTEDYDFHNALVVHPDKFNADKVTVMSGKGSSSIGQEADNSIAIQKNEQERKSRVRIIKHAAFGRLGEIMFDVHDNGNKFYEN